MTNKINKNEMAIRSLLVADRHFFENETKWAQSEMKFSPLDLFVIFS